MSPEAYNAEVLKALKSIEDRVSRIEGMLMVLARGGQQQAASGGNGKTGGGLVAPASDLDSQYGNPVVRKDPKRWSGASYAGCHFSECPPEYLESLADFKDWQADRDEEKGTEDGIKYARYGRKDAARARGWAERLRNGWTPMGHVPTGDAGSAPQDDDIPF